MTAATTTTTATTSVNSGQMRRWNGAEGALWAAHSDRFDRMLEPVADRLATAAAATAGEAVLDVGCGAGATTLALARAVGPAGTVAGIDVSTRLLTLGQRRAEDAGIGNTTFVCDDAQEHSFDAATLDLVCSRMGMMLFGNPHRAFTNLRRALRPSGRLAFATWAEAAANGWSAIPHAAVAAHIPVPVDASNSDAPAGGACAFSLADPFRTRTLLHTAGFVDVRVRRVQESLWIAQDLADACDFFESAAGDVRALLPDALFDGVLTTLRALLAPYLTPDGVRLPAAYVIVTATASCTG